MKIKRLSILGTALFLSACSTTYYNPNIQNQDALERQRIIDEGVCTRVSVGAVPMPSVRYYPSNNQNYNISGKVQTRYSNGLTSNSIYSSNISSYPNAGEAFSNGLANGANAGIVFRAQMEKNKIYKGCMYNLGWTTTKPKQIANNTTEMELLKKASASGDSEASLKLYKLYAGLEVSRYENNELMLKYLKLASDQNNAEAQSVLAQEYYSANILPKDLNKSADLFRKSCEQNNDVGCLGIASLYAVGHGVKQNYIASYVLFTKSNKLGNKMALEFRNLIEKKMNKEELEKAKIAQDIIY